MNETSITIKSIGSPTFWLEVASVGFFQQPHASILTKFHVELAVSGINGNDSLRFVVQQAIAKATGGSSDIETNLPRNIDLPMGESFFQLQTAAAYVFQMFTEQTECCVVLYGSSSFFDFLTFDEDFAGKDQSLCPFPRRSEPALDE